MTGSVSEITDTRTGCAHLVTDAAFAAGRRAGRYAAACGADVFAASLTTPERRRCEDCRRTARQAAR